MHIDTGNLDKKTHVQVYKGHQPPSQVAVKPAVIFRFRFLYMWERGGCLLLLSDIELHDIGKLII